MANGASVGGTRSVYTLTPRTARMDQDIPMRGSSMPTWTIAAVQMDCRFADRPANLRAIRARLAEAAAHGAQLVVFPECILTGYGFDGLDEALPHAEPLPGPSTEAIASDCRQLNVFC